MLLLVLILVLVAFGLLVVALLTGNVLCAWLSVVVSVAAAVVLIVDWMQRRSAEKAGRVGANAAAPRAEVPAGDHDPVTEVLPVVAAGGSGPRADGAAVSTAVDAARFGGRPDPQRTVTMAAVQPPGSDERPSGAEAFSAPSGGSSSPGVTVSPEESAVSDASTAGAVAHPVRQGDAEATVVVDVGKRSLSGTDESPRDSASTAASGEGPEPTRSGDGGAAHAGASAAVDSGATADGSSRSGTPATVDESSAGVRPPAEPTGQPAAEPVVVEAGAATGSGASASERAAAAATIQTARGRVDEDSGRRASSDPDGTGSTAGAPASAKSENGQVTVAHRQEAANSRTGPPLAEPDADGTLARSTFGGPVAATGHELFDPVARSNAEAQAAAESPEPAVTMRADDHPPFEPPPSDDGEPPEEPLDPAVAQVVATLADQVFVVDEQPRYHVSGCRVLVAHSTIPLPAREAVELGFSPCGWCTPDAVLGGRHHAGAHP